MLLRLVALLATVVLACPFTASAGRKARQNDGLLQVVTPVHRETATAHPHVNVLVILGSGFDDTPADPSTFRAKLGRRDVTSLFERLQPGEIPNTDGFRARLNPEDLKIGRRKNMLKLQVRSGQYFPDRGKARTFRDKDKVKFVAVEGANQPPTALAAADTAVIVRGIPIQFDASGSQDPELDGLEYLWDFGDGTTSTEPRPTHAYEAIGDGDVLVTLTVSDGSESSTDELLLLERPPVDPDRTPGTLRVEADAALELGVVDVGGSVAGAFTVRNTDATATSQLKVFLESTDPDFSLSPQVLDLGPADSAEVHVAFAANAEGHASTRISLVASATGTSSASFLAHAYAGLGVGTGPTLATDPLYFKTTDRTSFSDIVTGIFADGRRIQLDTEVGGCDAPLTGLGDACFEDSDCAVHGATCGGTCIGGTNAGQPCVLSSECPEGSCFLGTGLFIEDMCGDAHGNVYLLSDDGTFTEPDPGRLTERSVTLVRLSFDDQGNVTDRQVLRRLNGETLDIACDANEGGRVYTPEYWDVDSDTCFRIERQELQTLRKSDGGANTVLSRLDSVEGIDNCNDLEDTADAIAVTPNGNTIFANFQDGGIWRAVPNPKPFLVNVLDSEILELHPDGSLMYATATNLGTVSLINLFKVTEAQVAAGPVSLQAIPPCATATVPTNGGGLFINGMAAGRAAGASSNGVAYVSFQVFGGSNSVLATPLLVRGVAAFMSPDGASTCTPADLIALDSFELVSF